MKRLVEQTELEEVLERVDRQGWRRADVEIFVDAARRLLAGEEAWYCDEKRDVVFAWRGCYSPVNAPELHAKCGRVLVVRADA